MKIIFTHKIVVPISSETIKNADGYFEELDEASEFEFSQEEYDSLRKNGGVYDAFDEEFHTIIADCEEERISEVEIDIAQKIVNSFIEKKPESTESSALQKLKEALQYAKIRKVYCMIVGGVKVLE